MRYDDSITKDWHDDIRTNTTTPYLVDNKNWGIGKYKPKKRPMYANTISIVTGHKYRIHWGFTGLNWEKLRIEIDQNYLETDKDIYFVHNFSDVRAAIKVKYDGAEVANDTIPTDPAKYLPG